MTETEWLACENINPMLTHLQNLKMNRTKRGRRKLMLFGCACCRRIWRLLTERGRRWVEFAERKIEGDGSEEEALVIKGQPRQSGLGIDDPGYWAEKTANCLRMPNAMNAASGVANNAVATLYTDAWLTATIAGTTHEQPHFRARSEEERSQAVLLREVVGNPFVPASMDPHLRKWGDGTISSLARAIYDEQAFDRLPVLADALEDAGCDNANLIDHCRRPGEHVRGCWAVDLLAGKD